MTKTDWTAVARAGVIRERANVLQGYSQHAHNAYGELCRAIIEDLNALAERVAADESAVPDGYTAILSDGKRYWADKPGSWGGWKPYFIGRPPAQPAQEQPGWKVPDSVWRRAICEITNVTTCAKIDKLAHRYASPPPPKEK